MPFGLENAYIWPPRELGALQKRSSGTLQQFLDAGRAYGHSHSAFLLGNAYIWATQRAPGALCHSHSPYLLGNAYIWATQGAPAHSRNAADAGRAYGHSHNAFLLGNAYILPPRKLLGHSRESLDAGRVTGHSHSAFLFGNAYILPPRELRRTRGIPWTRRGPMATRTVPFCLEMLTFCHPESSGTLH